MKILLVKIKRLRNPLAKALGRLGHTDDQAEDGAAADALIGCIDYEVVIMDRMMPGRDGLEVLQEWRRKGISVPILILTALNAVEEKVHGLLQGADDYLTKPFAFQPVLAWRLSHAESDAQRARGGGWTAFDRFRGKGGILGRGRRSN